MNIGIVLSGGMAKGAYQVGALKAIREKINMDDIKYISASSIGVLNGYAFLMNRLDEAEKMYLNLCDDDTRLFISQILRSSILQHDIASICSQDDVVDRGFYATLLDIQNKTIEYRNFYKEKSSRLLRLLKASVAMPIYNKAVRIGKKNYYDGGMVDNIPVYPLLEKNLDLIICLYFDEEDYIFENPMFDEKVLKIVFSSKSILKESLVLKRKDIKINIEEGYRKTSTILGMLLNDGLEQKEIKYRIAQLNAGKSKKVRITGDELVTNLNRVLKKFVKRKVEI